MASLPLAGQSVIERQFKPHDSAIYPAKTNPPCKSAFPDGNAGTIWVELSASPERVLSLRVADDGVGLPADLDIHNTRSLGLQLVTSLLEQLDCNLTIDGKHGVRYQIAFTRN